MKVSKKWFSISWRSWQRAERRILQTQISIEPQIDVILENKGGEDNNFILENED